jgi:hypothetical protein
MTCRLLEILAERYSAQQALDLEFVMGTPAGRRFVASIIFDVCKWGWRTTDLAIRDGDTESSHAHFLDGMEEVGRRLKYEAERHCIGLWRRLYDERMAEAEQAEVKAREKQKEEELRNGEDG